MMRSFGIRLGSAMLVAALSACAPPLRPMPLLPGSAMQGIAQTRSVRIAVEPYLEPDRQRAVFGRRLASDMVPLLVLVRNDGDQPLRLRRADLRLQADGETLEAGGWSEARASLLDLGRDVADTVDLASDARNHWLSFRLSDLFDRHRRRPADFGSWDLPTRAEIEPRQTLRGFVYFVRAAATKEDSDVALLVPLGNDGMADETETLKIPLRSRSSPARSSIEPSARP